MWYPVVAPRKPPQAPCSSQEATPAAASEPGPSTPPPAKRSKRTKAEPAAESIKGKGKAKGKAAKAKPAPQPGRWLGRGCNAALNMQRIGESRWRPLELCYWPEQGKLPAKVKEYPGLGYKRLRDKPTKAQQQQPAEAQSEDLLQADCEVCAAAGVALQATGRPASSVITTPNWSFSTAVSMNQLSCMRIGESRWRPLELCWWPEQGKLPAKGKEYLGLGYKRLRDKPPKAQQQQQPDEAHIEPAFDDPSNQELLAKLQQLGSVNLTEDHNTISHHSMQLAVAMQQHYSNPGKALELQAATLDKGNVADLIEEAAKQRRLLALEEDDSLQDTVPLPRRMRHVVHVCRPRGTDQRRGRVVLVDEHRTTRVSSAVNGQQPCERQLNKRRTTRPADWKPPAGQVHHRLVRPAWSQQRDQPVRGMMWCPVVAPRKPPQAPGSSQEATQAAASEPGPSTPLPAKRSKRTKAEPAAEPNKGTGKAAKAKPAPQPGRWLGRDCNAALNMQRIGESRWRPLELCYWPEQGKLPAKGKEYPGLGYKRVRDKPPKAQQQPAEAQLLCADPGLHGVQLCERHQGNRRMSALPACVQHNTTKGSGPVAQIKIIVHKYRGSSPAATSLEANLKHITVTLATWDAVWEVYLDPKWAQQRLRLYGAQDRTLEQFFKKPPQALCSSQEATQLAASDPGPSTPPPAKRTKAEPAAEPTAGQGQGCQGKASNTVGQVAGQGLQCSAEHAAHWGEQVAPTGAVYWPEQGKLPAKGKEYPGLEYKRVQDKPPKAQQQQPAEAQ
ncbi:hypothetical protein QJQ45_026193 [Haematococcus lacustris]|nr:hypothetical protein QJQ45_026193 [Haematococcus lacustris]